MKARIGLYIHAPFEKRYGESEQNVWWTHSPAKPKKKGRSEFTFLRALPPSNGEKHASLDRHSGERT